MSNGYIPLALKPAVMVSGVIAFMKASDTSFGIM